MKKVLFGAAALLLMASCSGNGEEKSATDTSAVTDTAIQTDNGVQNEKTDALKNSEADLKQADDGNDSKAILAALPDPKRLLKEGDPAKYLKSLGFKGSQKEKTNEFGETTLVGKYSFNAGNKSISIRWENLMGTDEWDVTIKDDDQALEEFYSKAKKQQGKGTYWEIKVKKSGNTVKICRGSD